MVQENLSKLVLVVGPTATGKSALALHLARKFPFEIVNMDASQLYLGMDVGTAKPTAEERGSIPHHLFDVTTPDRPLNAGRYVEMADQVINEISARGNVPLFVGGTGLYARALLRGLASIPAIAQETRARVMKLLEKDGPVALHARLAEVDAVAAARLSPNDSQRVSRALEVFLQTGTPISVFQEGHGFGETRYPSLTLGLALDLPVLAERIGRRLDSMLAGGLIPEVEALLKKGYDPDLRTFKALGYREVMAWLAGELSIEELRRRIVVSHLRYAKRQRTWFRKEPDVVWLTPGDLPRAESLVREFLEFL